MRFAFRLANVFCYFLPFTFFLVTCNGDSGLTFSYNRREADTNLTRQAEWQATQQKEKVNDSVDTISNRVIADTAVQPDTTSMLRQEAGGREKKESILDRIAFKMLIPADHSLSGIGVIFYFKNSIGKIAIAISLLVSLILVAAFKTIKSAKSRLYLVLTAWFCLLLFIIDSLASSVTLLWGAWLLMLLLSVQLWMEFADNKKPAANQR